MLAGGLESEDVGLHCSSVEARRTSHSRLGKQSPASIRKPAVLACRKPPYRDPQVSAARQVI